MNDELRAAAERLRKLYGGQSYHETYGCEQTGGGHQQRDERLLIDAYLTEHPADDAEPVTVEWLAECGFEQNYGCFTLPNYSGKFDIVIWADGFNVRWDGQTNCKTRGEVRRLCAALGIQLAEGEG